MLVQAFTVFLALIGTTLSCLSTGARVTYAMGRDEELGAHFGMLHGKTLTPHRSIWTLAIISAVIGIITVSCYLGGTTPAALDPKYHNLWYSFGVMAPETVAKMPNTLVIVTLISNFGTFMLYMITCVVAMVAFREHHTFHGFKHVAVPVFGLIANLVCMLFYLVGPFTVAGMSVKEPYIALGACALWGVWGAVYFLRSSKAKGKAIFVDQAAARAAAQSP
jgi:amino acid transporter